MKIVIEIPDKVYTYVKREWEESEFDSVISHIFNGIKNGVVIPENHGDLIDKSKIHKAIPAEEDNCTGMGMTYDEMYAYNDGIDAMYDLVQDAKPIIEADKGVLEKINEKQDSLRATCKAWDEAIEKDGYVN